MVEKKLKSGKESENKNIKKVNWRVVGYSLIALGFVGLGIFVDWIWFLGAVFMIWLNQKELMGK
ncbi:hypothetical protein HOD75_01050 [archaeon]|mgnify:CR=1 FL=1|jgi:hypothetical protein|nr:hypothetical protein [archaeon]MBT4241465.1 hypothetical protein [archaeon]MBT4417664.1 hypothetical protein [archaeon]